MQIIYQYFYFLVYNNQESGINKVYLSLMFNISKARTVFLLLKYYFKTS